jgi:Peptidase inhibitor family I36
MHKSFLARILLLAAFVLIPSCMEGLDGPSANDPQTVDTEGEAMAGDETAGSREIGTANVVPTGSGTTSAASDCHLERLCLWRGKNFEGEMLPLVKYDKCQNLSVYAFGGATSSWFNHWNGLWTLYDGVNCTGPRFQAPSGQRAAEMPYIWDNNISSVCHGPDCP